jgi:hypothetical protein
VNPISKFANDSVDFSTEAEKGDIPSLEHLTHRLLYFRALRSKGQPRLGATICELKSTG